MSETQAPEELAAVPRERTAECQEAEGLLLSLLQKQGWQTEMGPATAGITLRRHQGQDRTRYYDLWNFGGLARLGAESRGVQGFDPGLSDWRMGCVWTAEVLRQWAELGGASPATHVLVWRQFPSVEVDTATGRFHLFCRLTFRRKDEWILPEQDDNALTARRQFD